MVAKMIILATCEPYMSEHKNDLPVCLKTLSILAVSEKLKFFIADEFKGASSQFVYPS